MAKIIEILLEVQMIISLIFIILAIYQLLVCIMGLARKKVRKEVENKQHRFMAVIPAHNEEMVIKELIESIKQQDYQQNLIDIYVIADNCTDQTAQVAKSCQVNVFERFDSEKKRKGYALEWFFDKILEEKADEYDAFCVFDADNIVEKHFFKEMNKKLCEGEKIVQGYRDIKNASDSWITANYALFYWVMNRCYHYSRYKLGLSPLINGTGFMVAMSVLKETNGWHSNTITEDIEFSLKSVARGYKIGFAEKAIVYDEQPLSFKESCVQRLRWSVGHIQCFREYFVELSKQKTLTPTMIDAAIYILCMPLIILALFNIMISGIIFVLVPHHSVLIGFGFRLFSSLTTVAMGLISLLTLIHDKKNLKSVWLGILTVPIFMLSWFVINIFAFTKKDLEWKQIKHYGRIKSEGVS